MTRSLTAEEIWPEDEQVPLPDERCAILRRLLPASRGELRETRPDLWPETRTGEKRLERDLARLGATWTDGVWHPPKTPACIDCGCPLTRLVFEEGRRRCVRCERLAHNRHLNRERVRRFKARRKPLLPG